MERQAFDHQGIIRVYCTLLVLTVYGLALPHPWDAVMWRQYHQPGSLLPSASWIGQDHDNILQNLKEHIYNYLFLVLLSEKCGKRRWEHYSTMFMSLTLMLHHNYANFTSEQVIDNAKKGKTTLFCGR